MSATTPATLEQEPPPTPGERQMNFVDAIYGDDEMAVELKAEWLHLAAGDYWERLMLAVGDLRAAATAFRVSADQAREGTPATPDRLYALASLYQRAADHLERREMGPPEAQP